MTNKLNILIVEDELLIAEMLKEILTELACSVVGIAKNYEQTCVLLSKSPIIDFIFLDINLANNQSGFQIAQKLKDEHKIPFMFITSYSDPITIQTAASFEPQGYIIKPFTKSDLLISLELFKSKHYKTEDFFILKEGSLITKIKHSDILWVKSENIYIEIKTTNKIYVSRNSLQNFLETINSKKFIKIHRSFIVNIQYIKSMNKKFVLIQDKKLPISRKHYEALLNHFSK